MITTFYQKRLPFVIIVAGTECMGKSTLVTQLGERVNISNIVQTSILHKVMHGLSSLLSQSTTVTTPKDQPLEIEEKTEEDIVKEYVRMCRQVRKGCNFDI